MGHKFCASTVRTIVFFLLVNMCSSQLPRQRSYIGYCPLNLIACDLLFLLLYLLQFLLIMFFGGGFPFGFQQDHHQDEDDGEQQEQQSFYDLLDCSPDAPIQEINHKYEALVAKHGPDGQEADEQLLEQIKEAYDVLSDPQKRKLYDMSQQSGGHGGIFNMMFGNQQKAAKKNDHKPKMQPTKRVLEVSLQNIFAGGVVDLHHQRARLCESCDGKGGQNIKKCPICKGQGGVVQLVQMGPGMYSQMQKQCQNCKGLGQMFDEGIKCKDCDGRKICKKEVDLPVTIPIGIPAGEIITLEAQGNQVPQASVGDLLLIVQETPHPHFTRKGADLFYKKTISLVEALIGFNFKLSHLDQKQYTVYTRAGEVVGDHSKKIVRGRGMPFFKNEELRGNLIIEFKVTMPKRGDLTPTQIQILTKVLPGHINTRPTDSNYQMLEDFDKEHLNSSEQGGKKKEDDEEEGEEGIGCQPQ